MSADAGPARAGGGAPADGPVDAGVPGRVHVLPDQDRRTGTSAAGTSRPPR